jgi:DNA-binding response OmpR family regulator
LDAVREKAPSLVVLDFMLPDIDGFEICSRIKSADATRHIPVIMLTAACGEKNRERGSRCGAADYMTKPFEPDKLMATMERHARHSGNGLS